MRDKFRTVICGPWIRYPIGGLVGGLVGALLCSLMFSVSDSIEVDTTISINSIFQGLLTIFVAVIVASFVQRFLHSETRAKDFLIQQLDELIELTKDLEEIDNDQKLTDVTSTLKKISTKAKSILDVVKALSQSNMEDKDFTFRDDISELRILMTDTPTRDVKRETMSSEDLTSETKDSIIRLADRDKEEVMANVQHFQQRLVQAKVKVIQA